MTRLFKPDFIFFSQFGNTKYIVLALEFLLTVYILDFLTKKILYPQFQEGTNFLIIEPLF